MQRSWLHSPSRRLAPFATAIALTLAVSGPVGAGDLGAAQAPHIGAVREVHGGEVKLAMIDLVRIIEQVSGQGSATSQKLWSVDVDAFARWSPRNRAAFVEAVQGIRFARDAAATRDSLQPGATSTLPVGSAAFYPRYPSTSTTLDYEIIRGLGWVQNPTERPHGDAYDYYVLAMVTAKEELDILSLACTVAGCDPTGIVCAAVCGGVNGTMAAYMLTSVPLRAANRWTTAINDAELEAAYRNALLALTDLSAHDDRVMTRLNGQAASFTAISNSIQAHDSLVRSRLDAIEARLGAQDADLRNLLAARFAAVLANQAEIIKLLKTPEGRRPGWGKEGY